MRVVPVLYPSDLGVTESGRHRPTGERSAPDIMLDVLAGEGARLARPIPVTVPTPTEESSGYVRFEAELVQAARDLADIVERVNAEGDFPLVLGGDHTALFGHVLGHSRRHGEGIGLAVLADARLDLDLSPEGSHDAADLALSGALGLLPGEGPLASLMRDSSVRPALTSVTGVRAPASASARSYLRASPLGLWTMERLELDGESAYRSALNQHLVSGPIVLSIDARGLDPDLMTAVRDPVPDGLDWSFLKRSLEQCLPHRGRLLGLDLCHVDPTRDHAGQTSLSRLAEVLAPFLRQLQKP